MSDEDRDDLIKLLRVLGMNVSEIAEMTGLHPGFVSLRLKQLKKGDAKK